MRGIVAAGLAIVVLAFAGCSDDPEPRFEEPTETPSASDPTSSAVAEPEPWEEKSKAGAVAFATHWIDLFNEAIVDGDTSELARASDPECVSCNDVIDRIRRTYAQDGFFETEGWRVLQSTVLLDRSSAEIGLRVLRTKQRYRDSGDDPVMRRIPSV